MLGIMYLNHKQRLLCLWLKSYLFSLKQTVYCTIWSYKTSVLFLTEQSMIMSLIRSLAYLDWKWSHTGSKGMIWLDSIRSCGRSGGDWFRERFLHAVPSTPCLSEQFPVALRANPFARNKASSLSSSRSNSQLLLEQILSLGTKPVPFLPLGAISSCS